MVESNGELQADKFIPLEQETPPETKGRSKSTEKRNKQRTAYELAQAKEEQQELALERAIQEIHWRHAADALQELEVGGEGEVLEADTEDTAEDVEHDLLKDISGADQMFVGLTAERGADWAPAAAMQSGSLFENWEQHIRQEQQPRPQGQPSVLPGQPAEPSASASAWQQWQEWHQQEAGAEAAAGAAGYGPYSSQGGGAAYDGGVGYDGGYHYGGYGGGTAQGAPGGYSWAGLEPQTAGGGDGMVRVPLALVQRYQALEWAEWCRQYERWQRGYEQWYSLWTSYMWQAWEQQAAGSGSQAPETGL